MKALMFGWEFPPHILGGLGTASYGLTKGMWECGDMDITFVIPSPSAMRTALLPISWAPRKFLWHGVTSAANM